MKAPKRRYYRQLAPLNSAKERRGLGAIWFGTEDHAVPCVETKASISKVAPIIILVQPTFNFFHQVVWAAIFILPVWKLATRNSKVNSWRILCHDEVTARKLEDRPFKPKMLQT